MKQTAVEWIESKVLYIAPSSLKDDLIKLFEQAKEMEANQTQEAYNQGNEDAWELFYRMSKS